MARRRRRGPLAGGLLTPPAHWYGMAGVSQTDLASEMAAAGEFIIVIWAYGQLEIVTDLGTSGLSNNAVEANLVSAIQSALAINPDVVLTGRISAGTGVNGGVYASAVLQVTTAGDGVGYATILNPLDNLAMGLLGSTASIVGADYADQSADPGAAMVVLENQDPTAAGQAAGAISAQVQAVVAQAVAAAKAASGGALAVALPWIALGLLAIYIAGKTGVIKEVF
jgi:hypothetical protein